ncbi:MAG: hypothetical protein NW216_03880 [Hyphomicrobium sp.]|nr:hypothetical protein [Hyphomicrobium sp.]
MDVFQAVVTYLADHPGQLTALALFVLLAFIGAWYVLSHHLGSLLITLLCAAGFASGALVIYRGWQENLNDLMGVGAFLIVIFPLIYQQAIKVARIAFGSGAPPEAKGHAKRAGV